MRMSFVAMDRLVEEKARSDPELRSRRPLLSTARTMSDEDLVEKLLPVFGDLDRQAFQQLCASYVSAQEMVAGSEVDGPGRFDADWPWLAATVLWERWAPNIPNFERVDIAMQAGYHEVDNVKQGEIWLGVWSDILAIADRGRMTTLSQIDDSFAGTQSLYNWVQDVEMELSNGREAIQRFLNDRRRFCEEYLERFGDEHPEIDRNMWRAIAEVHNETGDVEKVDRLYREQLTADPGWGWGWISWADCYWLFTPRERDFPRGEAILREALAVSELRDRTEVLERLANLYAESGRPEEERKVREQLEAARRAREPGKTRSVRGKAPPPGPQFQQRVVKKTGRNAPCPCGSGEKYKKCCGKR